MTNNTQQGLLNTQSNTNASNGENNPSSELITRQKIPNTPFELIGNNETQYYFIALGKFKLTENFMIDFEEKDDPAYVAKDILEHKKWDIITTHNKNC